MIVLAGLVFAILGGTLATCYAMSFTPPPRVSSAWLADPASAFAALKPPFHLLMIGTLAQVSTLFKLALIGIAAAEWFSIRSWMFHVANGAMSGFFASLLYQYGWVPGLNIVSPDQMLMAGIAGATIYWAIAGSRAGFRPDVEVPAPFATHWAD